MASPDDKQGPHTGTGGELHQQVHGSDDALTTNQGLVVADDQNSLKVGMRGPTLLEDFILREKITHFDHERIPERVVHARGYGAHGYFQPYRSFAALTRAGFLQDPARKTPVFVRFSTVAGNKGSADTVRDVRGFAVKFYTEEGNFDLVGNNIPVFFVQDAIKFPDFVHSVKPEPDRDFPQAQSAHDTFWDFTSLTPESIHMLLWAMSDRAIPRSYRMMEGFGVHTFRMINAEGVSTFVKFHWRPKLGSFALVWDEAVKLAGADPDFHRRDLWTAIESGTYPEYELCVQAFDEKTADAFDFDILDASKIIPEEEVPLTPLGKMVLDRNVGNFFAETEQVAFCPSHLVPGIDFTPDPLLQGRLFSYLDTQLSRLGGPNFHEIPINRPRCPVHNYQRDGHMRMAQQNTRVAYEPNTFDTAPREDPQRGFASHPVHTSGEHRRIRPESFADHYTQARQFWISQTEPEQRHIVMAFAFELGKVDRRDIRQRMLGHLQHVHPRLAEGVAQALGMEGEAMNVPVRVPPRDKPPSPALSLLAKAPKTFAGRKLGVLLTDGAPAALLQALRQAAADEGSVLEVVAPRRGGVTLDDGTLVPADQALAGGPSALYDAVALVVSPEGVRHLLAHASADAIDWVRQAFSHLKVIGYVEAATPLLQRAHVDFDRGVVTLAATGGGIDGFLQTAKDYRIWDREPKVRGLA